MRQRVGARFASSQRPRIAPFGRVVESCTREAAGGQPCSIRTAATSAQRQLPPRSGAVRKLVGQLPPPRPRCLPTPRGFGAVRDICRSRRRRSTPWSRCRLWKRRRTLSRSWGARCSGLGERDMGAWELKRASAAIWSGSLHCFWTVTADRPCSAAFPALVTVSFQTFSNRIACHEGRQLDMESVAAPVGERAVPKLPAVLRRRGDAAAVTQPRSTACKSAPPPAPAEPDQEGLSPPEVVHES